MPVAACSVTAIDHWLKIEDDVFVRRAEWNAKSGDGLVEGATVDLTFVRLRGT